MGFPKISILFKQVAAAAIKTGDRGIVALFLKDALAQAGNHVLTSVAEIPAGLSNYNKAQITEAFKGGVNPPKKVIVIVSDTTVTNYTDSMAYAETVKFDYLAVPGADATNATAVATWLKGLRDTKSKKAKVVLPNTAGNHEGVINVVSDVKIGGVTVTAKDMCARLAGIFAGTPLVTSATFFTLPEVEDTVLHPTEDEVGTMIDAGKLVLFNDGEKVKIARAVNSLVTTTSDKGEDFKKIKIVDTLDMIAQDIKRTAEDNYIGKVSNSYDNKVLLQNAINGYLLTLEGSGLLDRGMNGCSMDMTAQRNYLTSVGKDISEMTEIEIKVANTGSKVFLAATVKPLDAMEDITLTVNL